MSDKGNSRTTENGGSLGPGCNVRDSSQPNRVLGLWDLTLLGVGSVLATGIYLFTGQISKEQSGPSIMISFAIATIVCCLTGLCYTEFSFRVTRAGSAYIYSYVCIGEFVAFIVGWNMILEYMLAVAAICRTISLYMNALFNNMLMYTFSSFASLDLNLFGTYYDFLASGLVLLFGVPLSFGVKTSKLANHLCTGSNFCTLLFFIIAGSLKSDIINWRRSEMDINNDHVTDETITKYGIGGFFPYGFKGTLQGAATCFYGFVIFDSLVIVGDEVRNPRRNIPYALWSALAIVFLCYFGVSTVLTLMVPYYLQDLTAPIAHAFRDVYWTFATWILTIGGIVGLMSSLFGALFPLTRNLQHMIEDGIAVGWLGKLHPTYGTPVQGSILLTIIASIIAGLFDVQQLLRLLSIGALLAYTTVAICIIMLRYTSGIPENLETIINGTSSTVLNTSASKQFNRIDELTGKLNQEQQKHYSKDDPTDTNNNSEQQTSLKIYHPRSISSNHVTNGKYFLLWERKSLENWQFSMDQLINRHKLTTPNAITTRIVGILVMTYVTLTVIDCVYVKYAMYAILRLEIWSLIGLGGLTLLTAIPLLCICWQPREPNSPIFRVSPVPLLPAFSILLNIYLMLQLDPMAWIRLIIWMVMGLPLFGISWCLNDIKNPHKRHPNRIIFELMLRNQCDNQLYQVDHLQLTTKINHLNNLNNHTMDMNYNDHEQDDINVSANCFNQNQDNSNINNLENYQTNHKNTSKEQISLNNINTLNAILPLDEIRNDLLEIRKSDGTMFYIQNNNDVLQDTKYLHTQNIKLKNTRNAVVATVHNDSNNNSCCSGSSSNNFNRHNSCKSWHNTENVIENEPKNNDFLNMEINSKEYCVVSSISLPKIRESYIDLATAIVDEILNSPEIWKLFDDLYENLEKNAVNKVKKPRNSSDKKKRSIPGSLVKVSPTLVRASTTSTSLSTVSPPWKSEEFRAKLSQLMTQKSQVVIENQQQHRTNIKQYNGMASIPINLRQNSSLKGKSTAFQSDQSDQSDQSQMQICTQKQIVPANTNHSEQWKIVNNVNDIDGKQFKEKLNNLLRQGPSNHNRIYTESIRQEQSNAKETQAFGYQLPIAIKLSIDLNSTPNLGEILILTRKNLRPTQYLTIEKSDLQ